MNIEFILVLALAGLNLFVVFMMIRLSDRALRLESACGFLLECIFTKCEIKPEHKNEFKDMLDAMEKMRAL